MPCKRVCNLPVPPDVPECVFLPNNTTNLDLKKSWEAWDLRILILYILYTQLFLYFFGRRRRKSFPSLLLNANVWLLYLLSELLATIALGKLSSVDCPDCPDPEKQKITIVRSLWAPTVLFYLGGPDTITVLRLEENHMWLRHLIGLFAQGFRTSYVLYLTWSRDYYLISIVALLMLIPGLIKYAERVWVIRYRRKQEGFVQFGASTMIGSTTVPDHAKLIYRAYSYFQTMKPHNARYLCKKTTLESVVQGFRVWVLGRSEKDAVRDAFKLMEIELGFTYDIYFSKVDTIFTVWGCFLRFVTFSCLVSVLVLFIRVEKPPECLLGDIPITIILLLGAIFLDIGGFFLQIVSDWAVVWACKLLYEKSLPSKQLSKQLSEPISRKQPSDSQFELPSKHLSKQVSEPIPSTDHLSQYYTSEPKNQPPSHLTSILVTPILCLHERLISRRRRWCEMMGQFKLLDYWLSEDKPKRLEKIIEAIFGEEKMLNWKFGSRSSVSFSLKEQIFNQIQEMSMNVETMQTSDMKSAGWTVKKYGCLNGYAAYATDLEFDESVVIWHLATEYLSESCPDVEKGTDDGVKATKLMSHYMMYLLDICPDRFPIRHANDSYKSASDEAKKFFKGSDHKSWKTRLCNKECVPDRSIVKNVRELVSILEKESDRWKIMSSVWIEMMFYAANYCPIKYHVQELRNGGELLTHVWLLLMHFGVAKKLEDGAASSQIGEATGTLIKESSDVLNNICNA